MKRILIINGDEDTIEVLQEGLSSRKYDVKFTNEPTEVTKIIEHFEPGLIIIDIKQKEVIPAIKNHDSTIPLLLMTGYNYHGPYSDLPVDNTIEKPFTVDLLQSKVDRLIEKVLQ